MPKNQNGELNFWVEDSLFNLADNLVSDTENLLSHAKTEEDLKIGFEKLLEPILKKLGVTPSPQFERSIYNAGRADALHGQVVIEYEKPRSFKSKAALEHARDQLIGYIQGLSESQRETLFLFEAKFIGVGFDGDTIFFVRYKGDKRRAKIELETEDFLISGPFEFNASAAQTLLTHLRALDRLPLTAENLADKFGPKGQLAPKAVAAFANSLEHWGDQAKVRTYFNEWSRLFGIVYGERFGGHLEKETKALETLYKVGKETDFQELLFAVHTYFAFLMKLIAAELLTLKETSFHSSLASELTHISEDELKEKLEYIEGGGIYIQRGITNFLEGDFFRWYLDGWSPRLREALQDITRALSEFEPRTGSLNPAATRDLLKKLYQYLVPQEVRHSLGEYYTPDWLAEFLLNEVGYKGDTLKRVLDPACGSGTFLVLAIQRAKEHGSGQKLRPLEVVKRIAANIWGFDLNPLAVIAARTNYLFALGDLANELQRLEIPIYLTDSVNTPNQTTGNLLGNYLEVPTSVGVFQVPTEWVRHEGFLLGRAAPIIEKLAKDQYSVSEAMVIFQKEGLIFSNNKDIIKNFYSQILELEKQHKNGIWGRFLKNAYAPVFAGKFDYVVGNPPWIRWGYLSKEYREATLPMWINYGLFSLKGHAARLGGGEKDFSMLFTYAATDYYLKNGAKLGFLITQEVFKSKGAGEGFRRFKLGDKEQIKVLKAHDLVTVQPFEGAANKTALIILQKGAPSIYPVPYTVWTRKKGIGKIPTDAHWDGAAPLLKKEKLLARPIGNSAGSWQTISKEHEILRRIEGKNFYRARRGASTEPYGVFWLDIIQALSDGNLIIRNLPERGKRDISKVTETIEPDLVYPAVNGGDIERWGASPSIFFLAVQDPAKKCGYSEKSMKEKWPRTFNYLVRFKKELLDRAAYKKYHEDSGNPFYSQYNIADYSFSRFKVVWKRMANDIVAAVISQHKTSLGYKIVMPTDTTSFFPCDNEDEAHYLCAIINSISAREFVKSYSSAGRGFGAPSVMEHIGIPKFDNKNKLNQKLAETSQKCHRLKAKGNDEEIEKLEKEADTLTMKLFKL